MSVLPSDGELIEKTRVVNDRDKIGSGDVLDNIALEGNRVRVGCRDLV